MGEARIELLRRIGSDFSFTVEVHTEDDDEFGGYNLDQPLGPFTYYPKDRFEVAHGGMKVSRG